MEDLQKNNLHSLIIILLSVCLTWKWEFSPLFPHCHSIPHNCPPNWMITLRPPTSIGCDIFIELAEPWKCRTLLRPPLWGARCDRFQDVVFFCTVSSILRLEQYFWGAFPRRKCRTKVHRKKHNFDRRNVFDWIYSNYQLEYTQKRNITKFFSPKMSWFPTILIWEFGCFAMDSAMDDGTSIAPTRNH